MPLPPPEVNGLLPGRGPAGRGAAGRSGACGVAAEAAAAAGCSTGVTGAGAGTGEGVGCVGARRGRLDCRRRGGGRLDDCGLLGCGFRSGCLLCSGLLGRLRRCLSRGERFLQLAYDGRLDRRRRRSDELPKFLELGHHDLALDTELFGELVDPDLCHNSPVLARAGVLPAQTVANSWMHSSVQAHRALMTLQPAFAWTDWLPPRREPERGGIAWRRRHTGRADARPAAAVTESLTRPALGGLFRDQRAQGGDVQRTGHAQRPGEGATALGEIEAVRAWGAGGRRDRAGAARCRARRHPLGRPRAAAAPRGPRPAADAGPHRPGHRVRPAPRHRARRRTDSIDIGDRLARPRAGPSPHRVGCRCASPSAGPRAGRSALPCRWPARAGSRAP